MRNRLVVGFLAWHSSSVWRAAARAFPKVAPDPREGATGELQPFTGSDTSDAPVQQLKK